MAMKKRFLGESLMTWYRQLIRNSKYRWIVLLGTLLYLVSPIDISPDVFPVMGWVDDGLVATIAITEITQMLLERKRNRQTTQPVANAMPTSETVIDVDAAVIS
jgi:uncharacterized membrane protein YkvA (DUF1232 family)